MPKPFHAVIFLSLLVVAGACDRGGAEPAASESGGGGGPAESAEAESSCPALSVTMGGEVLNVRTMHAYTANSSDGRLMGEFVRASEAPDETCETVLSNRAHVWEGREARYMTAFQSAQSQMFNTLMTAGYSETGVPLTYTEGADGTRTICIAEERRFSSMDGVEYVVRGEFRGQHCGVLQM